MASGQPKAYKQYQWIVADPQLLVVSQFEHVGQDVILQRVVNPRSLRRLEIGAQVTNLPHYSASRRSDSRRPVCSLPHPRMLS
jgi:hypothetical protein